MEPSHGVSTNSAGKIKAQNLHLLYGNEAPQGYPNNMPGANDRPGSTGSHSSEDSRKMDQSPTGHHSDDSLEAEMKYQEELKERVRASFADLGMKPEGVLQDSLDEPDEDDPGLRDSLEDLPPNNPIRREGTFVKEDELQDSLDATQDNNNHEDLPLQDSLDATKPIAPGKPNEPTAEEIQGYDRTIDDHMITYPATGPTLTSTRQSSGDSHHSNLGNSKPNSRRNSADSGKNSPKVSTLKRLKDNPNHGKLPPRLPNGLQERRNSSPGNSRQNSSSVGSAGSRRHSSGHPKPVPIPGINTHSRDNTPVKKVRERTRPKLGSKTQSKIHRLENGKEVQVEYISDDSGDEMHFVDEKGSPVDNFGLPLNDPINDSDMPKQYRIIKKPAPPKEPSPLEQQILNSRRVSSGGLKGHQQTETNSDQVVEPIIQPTQVQQVGIEESTLPPDDRPSVFGDVRVSSNTSKNSSGKESDRYNDLRFNMDAVKQAAAEQEAALRSRDNSGSNVRRVPSGNKNNNRNTPEEEQSGGMNYFSQQNSGGQYEQVEQQQEEKPQNVRQPENKYHTPESAYSQRNHVQSQYEDNDADPSDRQFRSQGQSWQGSASSSVRQFGYGGPGAPPQSVSHQPILGGAPQMQQLQSPPAVAPNQYFDYQQQQQQFNQSIDYSQPMQYDYDPNITAGNYNQAMPPTSYQQPVQSGFEPNVSISFQPNNMQFGQPSYPTQQWQYQQQPFQQQIQPQFIQQPPSQPQTAIYGGGVPQGSIQGPVNFNQGGFNQQPMPLQQQPQFYDQYNQPSAPYLDQNNFSEFQNNVPPPQGNYPALQGNVPLMQTNVPTPIQQPQQINNSQIANINPHPLRPPRQRPIQQGPPNQPIRQPMRAGPDFISKNKTLRFGPPKRTYQQLYSMKRDTTTQTPPLNPNVPLPSISRENSQDINPYRDVAGDDESWTKQLVEEQRQMALLIRGQSESNLQDVPNPSNGHSQASWSADHATAYARMQASQPQQSMTSPRAAKVAFSEDVYNSFESEDLRDSWSLPNSKRTSPYPPLPAIKKSIDRQSPLRTSDPDGYLVKMQKAKQGPQYKEYTLKDYRNLKKDMKLGGLGPDVEIISERQDKVNRQRIYAKTVMEQNRKALHQAKRKPVVAKKIPTPTGTESPSRRNIAIQYAKNIPKPRIPTPPEQVHERLYGALSRQQQEQQQHQEVVAEEMARLEELKARHMKEKEQVEKLRTEIPT